MPMSAQVTVKIAAFFRVSSEEWPFSSLAVSFGLLAYDAVSWDC